VPNLLARLPQRYNWPQYQASGETEKKIYQNERHKISPTKRPTSLYKTKSRYNMNTNNRPTIEKINWAQYARLRNIQQLKHSHKTAFSPSIQVIDGEDQMITNVKGVGLVMKNSRRNNRVIVNQLREYEGTEETDKHYWQSGYDDKPRQSMYETNKNNIRQTNNYQPSQTNYSNLHKLSIKEESMNNRPYSSTKGLTHPNSVIKNQIRGSMGYHEKDNIRQQTTPTNPRWKYRSTPSPEHRLVTWLPKLQGKRKGQGGSL
jgi:hypothetical protein